VVALNLVTLKVFMKLNNSKARSEKRVIETKEIIARLKPVIGGFSLVEAGFILNMERRAEKSKYISGKQIGWLRGLEKRAGGD
jgi:hypothetical protein